MKRLTKEEFIEKAKELYNDVYDYSLVTYKNNKTKIEILCPQHGVFLQTPCNHLNGHGCPHCGNQQKGLSNKLSQEQFLEKAKQTHGDRYDYKKTVYDKNDKKIIIICKEHGEFLQTANSHLAGSGCPKCKAEKSRLRETLTQEEFIEKANRIHGNRYKYDKVKYIDGHTKVLITCEKHGDFWQKPCLHLNNKQGCPKCGFERVAKFQGQENIDHLGNKFGSFIEKCKYWNINIDTYHRRKKMGWTEKESLTCPEKMSLSEYRISNYLTDNKINYLHNKSLFNVFTEQNLALSISNDKIKEMCQKIVCKTNNKCQHISSLRYDFIVLDENNKIKFIIEFDGLQHFEEISKFNRTKNDFEYRTSLDKLKEEFAKQFDVPLFRIRYDQIGKCTQIIDELLQNTNKYIGKYNPWIKNEDYWNIKKEKQNT